VSSPLDARPVIVAVAGPNGAGKSTFYEVFLAQTGLRYINADDIAQTLRVDAYQAADIAEALRQELVQQRESFIFETAFSDPEGQKVAFLSSAARQGYTVVLCFIGLEAAPLSDDRVAMRVAQGGHDVSPEKVAARFPRSLKNLARAIAQLPHVWVYDNSDLAHPFRKVLECEAGRVVHRGEPVPEWVPAL
jgi:predicted ABC-type ATPase